MPKSATLALPLPQPFELPLVLRGHGWVALAPHRYAGGEAPWHVPLDLDGLVVAAEVAQRGRELAVTLRAARAISATHRRRAGEQLAHMLRLHDDLAPFWAMCADEPRLSWVARRGGGRLLRSAGLFEDLMKLLFTTNCSWAATTSMTANLIAAIGTAAPDGSRAFPTAAACPQDEAFWRDTVRVGYRARACIELARGFATGELTEATFADPQLDTATVRKRLLALHGFGPYAAGQAMRLLGRCDDLALDSWCRATMAQRLGKKRPPSDAAIARRYRGFGRFAGLALWCDLTAPWHGEAEGKGAEAVFD